MWAMSVPMAKAMGKPRIFRPGVTIQAPAHAEEAADNAYADTQNDQARPEYLNPCNGHENI